ncbi:DUF411 domain-containing protein [Phormidium tenue FACHB-886]|nr:DUF411 domain-containing protein [Phormidium tenue FACHB-886]
MINQFTLLRRYALGLALCLLTLAAVILLATPGAVASPAALDIDVYRDPGCSCCGGWMDHLVGQGFQPKNIPAVEMESLKRQWGVPDGLASCHTAVIDGYVIEGHVPAADIKRLLAEHPDVVGIAVPGMPVGTPGMEEGESRDSFTVFAFDASGKATSFNEYSF